MADLGKEKFVNKHKNPEKIRVFSRGSTTYWNTLKQLRIARIQQGSLGDLDKILTQKMFLKEAETAEKVVIEPSKIMISEENKTSENKATDHLFRLWAYNKTMALIGDNYSNQFFDDKKAENTEGPLRLSEKAHIVTPVSSLIVLEKQADYDRFDIKNSKNALGNAALNNSGAAPEPHEWALILLGLSFVAYGFIRTRRNGFIRFNA